VITQGGTEIARLDGFVFDDRSVYTIVISGNRRFLPLSLSVIKNK
jgi:hypothetical protein